jgi:LmbE family N-acetylglucosaminyl deacetylase
MNVVVVSAHPDDLEIACSGTLLRLKAEGASITSVITIKPSAEVHPSRSCQQVTEELNSSYCYSGFQLTVLDTDLHQDGRPNLVCDNRTMTKLEKLISNCDIAIIPNPQDYHQDHKNTYNLTWPIVRKKAKEIWMMDSWPYCRYYQENRSNLFYDITDQWHNKEALLKCYDSYFSSTDIGDIKIYNQWLGQRNNVQLAESFTVINKHV